MSKEPESQYQQTPYGGNVCLLIPRVSCEH